MAITDPKHMSICCGLDGADLRHSGEATGVEVDVLQRLQPAELAGEGRGDGAVVGSEGLPQVGVAIYIQCC